jgi:uncharacterized ferritin-like protein (DUF455 family)
VPDDPARNGRPELLSPARMPKRGRAGSPRTRAAMLHAVAHIERNAIDLAADMLARFAHRCPPAFADDWARVLDEEAQHFTLLADRLESLGCAYGDLPAHDGLWQSARATAHDLPARLAIVPQVLEARGLDVTPAMIVRFEAAGDAESAAILSRILADEIGHVAIGNRWYRWAMGDAASAESFHTHVRTYFGGAIRPPFNGSARAKAGLPTEWYLPLAGLPG